MAGGSIQDKLRVLADSAKYDASCASTRVAGRAAAAPGICHSYTPDGRCVSLLKVLLTNYCIYDCAFCVNRVSNDIPRARFAVDEVVTLTLDFYRRNYVDGLFLSSGIIQGVDDTMEQLVEVARRLRVECGFAGYIHLKAMPGAAADLLRDAGRYADRLSANIELPTDGDMRRLAPDKSHAAIEETMSTVEAEIVASRADQSTHPRAPVYAPAGQTTQLVVGASESSDRAILERSSTLYERHRLRRVYYTAYSPVPGQESLFTGRPTPLLREHRLYQADRLMVEYGFGIHELFDAGVELHPHLDPKLAWALRHPERFPVDVNRASREELLRVPGFGRRVVGRLLKARRVTALGPDDLRKLGARLGIARHFITSRGAQLRPQRPPLRAEQFITSRAGQRPLPFAAGEDAGSA